MWKFLETYENNFKYCKTRNVTVVRYSTLRYDTLRYAIVRYGMVPYGSRGSRSQVCDQELRIRLPVFKDDKQCWISCVIAARIVQHIWLRRILRRRSSQGTVTSSVRTHHYSSQEHLLTTSRNTVIWITVWIVGFTSKITSLSIRCGMFSTHSPVKPLLADRLGSFGVCAMEKLPLLRFFARFLSHADFSSANCKRRKKDRESILSHNSDPTNY